LIVLDMDPRNGGYKSRESLAIEHGELAETAEQSTGGGKHLLLRYRNVKLPKQLAPGIDIKADGGYVIVAPSIHKSGKHYRWTG